MSKKANSEQWIYAASNEIGLMQVDGEELTIHRQSVRDLFGVFKFVIDDAGMIWLELGSGLLGRIDSTQTDLNLERFDTAAGVPDSWVQVFVIDGVARFNIADRLYRFDEASRHLVLDAKFSDQLPGFGHIFGRPVRDAKNRLWITSENRIHVFDTTTTPWSKLPFDLPPGLTSYNTIPETGGVVWLLGAHRLARFRLGPAKSSRAPLAKPCLHAWSCPRQVARSLLPMRKFPHWPIMKIP
ncbi:MAG: hypothetical protein J6386_11775 [Candidatus Synoicihabitans palmerolidicus]|nr:hypothetical protein [Candidatus Synoicihabitans palmerolidicus]